MQDVWGTGGDWSSYKDGASSRLGAVYACVKLIASNIAGCPLEQYRALPDGTAERTTLAPLFKKPARRETPFEWKYRAVNALALRGNAFGLPLELPYPSQLLWLPNNLVNDQMYPDEAPEYWYRARHLLAGELVHVAMHVEPGSVRGLSPLEAFRKTYEAGLAAEAYGAAWFDTGGQPTGVLQTDQSIDDVEAKTLKNRWSESRRDGGIAVLGNGAKYQAVQVTAEESQFLETQRFSVEQVARIYGVPPEMIGGTASSSSVTYANREQRAIDFVTLCLRPYLVALEDHLSRLVPGQQFVMFNTEKLLAGDLKTRVEARAIAIASHQMTPDEARAEEGRQPLTEEQQKQLERVPLTITALGRPKDKAPTATPAADATTPKDGAPA